MPGHLHACRFCKHAVIQHNPVQGCPFCTCAAHPSEARCREDADFEVVPLHEWLQVPPYSARPPYYDIADDPNVPILDGPIAWDDATQTVRLTDQQWIACQGARATQVYPERCNHYRAGFGICCKATIGRPRAHTGSHSYVPIPPNPASERTTDMSQLDTIRGELADIERQEEGLLERKERLLRKVERYQSRPADPDSDVVQFKVQFVGTDVVYKFAAIRVNGAGWYTTSRNHPGPYTWETLLGLIERDHSVRNGGRAEVFVADAWKRLSW